MLGCFRRMRAVLHVLCATSAAFQIGYVIGYSSAVTSDFRSGSEPLRMQQRTLSWFGSIITAWALCGSLIAVPLMKKLGKFPTVVACDAGFLIGWILVATARGHVQLFCGRSLTGLSMGMAFAVIPLYIGELSPPHIRGVLGTLFNVVVAAGIPAVYVLGVYLDWRDMAKFACAFAAFSVVVCGTLPESPYWLAANGKVERAVRVFRMIADARQNDGDDDDGNREKEIRERVARIVEARDRSKGFDMESFRQPHVIRPFFLVLLFCAIQQLSGINAVIYNVHYIFRAANFYDEDLASIMVGLVQLIVMMGAAPFMDRAGRRIMLIVSGLGTSACLLLLGVALYHVGGGVDKQDYLHPLESSNATVQTASTTAISSEQEEEEAAASAWAWVALVSSLFYIGFFAVGLGPIPFVLIGEMVPRELNELAGGVASVVNNLTSLVVIQTFISLSSLLAIHTVLWFYCGCCLLSAAVTWRLLPEVRGKTLMEIQDLFRRVADRHHQAESSSPDETSDLV